MCCFSPQASGEQEEESKLYTQTMIATQQVYTSGLLEEPYAHQRWPPMQIAILNSGKRVHKKQTNKTEKNLEDGEAIHSGVGRTYPFANAALDAMDGSSVSFTHPLTQIRSGLHS